MENIEPQTTPEEYPVFEIKESQFTSGNLMAFLEQAGQGCISGRVSEWPQLVPACRWAFEQLKARGL